MADEEQLKIIRQGVAAWNDGREKNPEVRPDLIGAHLKWNGSQPGEPHLVFRAQNSPHLGGLLCLRSKAGPA